MTENMILQGTEFNPASDVTYSAIKVNAVGGKSVGILNTASKKAVYLNTPLMLTWGINEYTDDKSGKVTYDMALQFPGNGYETDDSTAFLENMKAFEDKIKSDAQTNSKDWFGKAKMSPDVIDALYTPMLKYPKDKETGEPDYDRSPTLKVKIPFWEGEWKTEVYDLEGSALFPSTDSPMMTPKDFITKGSNVAVMLICGGIWFANGKFGVTWKLQQAAVKPKLSMKGKFMIKVSEEDKARASAKRDDDEDDDEDDDVPGLTSTEAQDSDEEEDVSQQVQEEIEEAPKKQVKKKVVRKKAT